MTITFVTSNDIKFKNAQYACGPYGITLERKNLELNELQATSEQIARHKAKQAFSMSDKPIVITDDEWLIHGLNGFPGAYMKMVNDWFTPQDWLNLTRSLQNRRITLRQHLIYQDAEGQTYFSADIHGEILHEARGHSPYSHLTVTSFDGGKSSRAETYASDDTSPDYQQRTSWHLLAEWLNDRDQQR